MVALTERDEPGPADEPGGCRTTFFEGSGALLLAGLLLGALTAAGLLWVAGGLLTLAFCFSLIENALQHHSSVRLMDEARKRGYVETLTGRRRRLPELSSSNQGARAAAERMAVNMPIQGTAADVIKIAMINIDRDMSDRGLKSRMSIQVHDELIFEVAPGEMEEVSGLAQQHMPSAMDLDVPLSVETKSGPNWGDME